MIKILVAALSLGFSSLSCGASLSGQLSGSDVERVVEVVGPPSASRLVRSAEPYDTWPGIKIGVELVPLRPRSLDTLGNQTGSVPGFLFIPRLFVAKGLVLKLEVIFNIIPSGVFDTLSTFGTLIKWTFTQEDRDWISAALYGAYTGISGFGSSYQGFDLEAGVTVSKDYVRLKPYVGAGLLLARGEITESLVRSGHKNSSTYTTLHLFAGTEVELPVNLTFQLDLMNVALGGSLFIGKKF